MEIMVHKSIAQSGMRDWKRILLKRTKRLDDSLEVFIRFGDKDSIEFIEEDLAKMEDYCNSLKRAIDYMKEHTRF